MNVNYAISPYPSLLQDMVAKIYEVAPSGAMSEVDSEVIPERNGAGVPTPGAGHQVPYNISFVGRDLITHEVRLYTASATLLHKYQVQPTRNTITVFTPIRFRIGDGGTYTPASGTTSYLNPTMAGLASTDYIAYRNGYGFMFEAVHIANNTGGFDLIQPGDMFSGDPAEEWTIIQQPQIVSAPINDSVVGKQWGPTTGNSDMFVDITSAVDYDPVHLRKMIRLAGSAAVFTFSAASVPPIGYIFRFTNFGAYTPGDPDPEIHFDNAPLLWGNTTKTIFQMPFGATAEFVWDGTSWNCSITNTLAETSAIAVRHTGVANLGNIVYEKIITISIPDQGTNNYVVVGSLRQNSNNSNVDVSWTTRDYTSTGFKVVVDEWATNTQDLKFDYAIIR